MILPAGVYQHYKGKKYLVIGTARHSETGERMVVYVPLYEHDGDGMAVRPLLMFIEAVPDPKGSGTEVPRFRYIGQTVEGE